MPLEHKAGMRILIKHRAKLLFPYLEEFRASYPDSTDGKRHFELIVTGREVGRKNFERILEKHSRGEDVTLQVIDELLPYQEIPSNVEKGRWIHIAPMMVRDLPAYRIGQGLDGGDLPKVAQAILSFFQGCNDEPESLAKQCEDFESKPYTKYLSTSALTPMLNSLRPEAFVVMNSKPRSIVNAICGTRCSHALGDYPTLNELTHMLLEELEEQLHLPEAPSEIGADAIFDMFSHWFVAIRKDAIESFKVWKIAPGAKAYAWQRSKEQNEIPMGWNDFGDLTGISKQDFDDRRDALLLQHDDWTKSGSNQVKRFLFDVSPGDFVVANQGVSRVLGVGVVSGDYFYSSGEKLAHRRPVDWIDVQERQVDFPGWRSTLRPVKLMDFLTILEAPKAEADEVEVPSYDFDAMQRDTHLVGDELARWFRALERKKQVVLYGPPGTGKTYVAERMARVLTSDSEGFVETVQFHPAYSYEDFMQGIRPRSTKGGTLTYEVVSGSFLRFCEEAQKVGDAPCVLIIDEINRANLSRVFGELMYLLEYRDQEIKLSGGDSFFIPDNVRIIGTMNTADRSIALVDHALRRRFAFLPLYPEHRVLRSFHGEHCEGFDLDGLQSLLEELNRDIADHHYSVGISYFLVKPLGEHLSDIWKMEIEPYLEEYFFDRPEKVDAYRWDEISSRVLKP